MRVLQRPGPAVGDRALLPLRLIQPRLMASHTLVLGLAWNPLEVLTGEISGEFADLIFTGSEGLQRVGRIEYEPNRVLVTAGLLGDMNLDGSLDTGDVASFVLALTDPATYEAQHGIDPAIPGDINRDGSFDTGDVAPFVALLTGANGSSSAAAGPAVPEPGTLALLGLGGVMLLRRRREHQQAA